MYGYKVVDKRKLEGEGFKYKKSFYKFLNSILYKELFKVYPGLHLAVDEHGENKFMSEFKIYIEKNHKPNLFSGTEFGFMASPDSVLIQLADVIAGTLGPSSFTNNTCVVVQDRIPSFTHAVSAIFVSINGSS